MTKKFASIIAFLCFFLLAQSQETGLVYLSNDQGKTWERADSGLPAEASANDFVRFQRTIYVATEAHGIYRSNDQGKSWQPSNLGLQPNQKVDALAANATTLFAGTYTSGIYVSIDNGMTWFPSNKGLTNLTIRSLDVRGDIIYAGTSGGLFSSADNGKNWHILAENMQINKLAFVDNKLFAATNKGVLLSKDQGQNWEWIQEKGAVRNIAAHNNSIYAMSFGPDVWKTANDGQSWLKVYSETGNNFTNTILSLGQYLIASKLSGLFISYTNGLSWEKTKLDLPLFKELKWLDGSTLIAATGGGGC